jgi:hypothetical protein
LLRTLKAARLVRLKHGFVAIPIDEVLLNEFAASSRVDVAAKNLMVGEDEPDPVPVAFLEAISLHHPVAYIRTRYHGGAGEQAAGVWEGGRAVLGPLVSAEPGPINAALRRVGVPKSSECFDEFDSLELRQYRRFEPSQPKPGK